MQTALDLLDKALEKFSGENIDQRVRDYDKFLSRNLAAQQERLISSYAEYCNIEIKNRQSAFNSLNAAVYMDVLQHRQSYTRDIAVKDFNSRRASLGFFQRFNLPFTPNTAGGDSQLLASPEWARSKMQGEEICMPFLKYLNDKFTDSRLNFDEYSVLISRGIVNLPYTTRKHLAEKLLTDTVFLKKFDLEIIESIKKVSIE